MKALNQALNHPLLDEIDLSGAAGIIANFTGGNDLTFYGSGGYTFSFTCRSWGSNRDYSRCDQ